MMLPIFMRFERSYFLAAAVLLTCIIALGVDQPTIDVIAFVILMVLVVVLLVQYRQIQTAQTALQQRVDALAGVQDVNRELATKLEQSRQMSASLAKINTFAQGTIFNLDVPQVMRAVCEVALQIAQADRVAVFYRDDTRPEKLMFVDGLWLTTAHRAWLEANGYQRRPSENSTTILTVVDTETGAEQMVTYESKIGEFRSKAEVLMRSGNVIIGVLIIYYNHPHYYENSELELLETFAYQIISGLDNAELVKALEAYAAEQAQLVLLSRTSTATLDSQAIIETVSELLRHMVDSEHVYVGLLDDDYKQMRFYTAMPETHATNETIEVLSLDELPEIAQLLNVQLVSSPTLIAIEQGSHGLKRLMTIHHDTSGVAAPLMAGGKALGVIVIGTPHHFGEQEARLLELAANQVALQLHNALQYQQVQTALERRLQQLALIEDIARQISSALNVDQLIGNVLDAATKATQADMAALAMLTDSGDFRIIGQEKVTENGAWQLRHLIRSSDLGIMGIVAKTRQPVILEDNRQSPEYLSTLSQGRYLSSLVVPLMRDETVIAVLNLESRQQGFFREEHVEFIKSLADHAVISIQNARLLQERQKQIDTLTNLRKLSLKLSSDTDRNSVVGAILQTALTALHADGAVMFQVVDEANTLTILGSLRSTGHGFEQAALSLPEWMIHNALESGETQIFRNITADARFTEVIQQNPIPYNSIIAAPIKRAQGWREVMVIAFEQENLLIEHDLNTLELLLIQAAGHLQNTVLYERVSMVNERIRLFLDSSSDGIVLLDVTGNIVQANLSAERLLGVELTDHIGKNFVDLLIQSFEKEDYAADTREGFRDTIRILRLEPQRIVRRQFELRRRGQPTYINEVSSPVFDHHHQMIGRLLVLRDVTEEKLLADYRDEIGHMLVHDLRSPLSAVYSGVAYVHELMAEPSEESDFSIREAALPVLDVALNSANNLLRLVDSLLDIAKLETRSMPLTMSRVKLQSMVNDVLPIVDASYSGAELITEIRIPDDLPDVFVDESKIKRVLLNLLDNAQRYSPQGGKILVEARLVEQKRKVLIRVNDSGRGIPPEERERVFEKFRQVSGTTPQRGRKGSGLGLTFCKLVIEAHGERIWIENEQESPLPGASFIFTIPVYLGQSEKDT